MNSINEYFDHVFYINSKKRIDRKKNIESRLFSLGIEATRFEAILGGHVDHSNLIFGVDPVKSLNNGEIGCYLSHVEIWKIIREKGYNRTLILEDDAEFCKDFLSVFEEKKSIIPDSFDMLYFGQWNYDNKAVKGDVTALKECIGDGLYRANRCWLTHAYSVDLKCVDYLIENTKVMYSCVDNVLADIQDKLEVYAFHPALIKQDGTKSSLR